MSFGKVIRINVLILKICGAIPLSEETIWKRICSYVLGVIAVSSLVIHCYAYVREFVINVGYLETAIETLPLTIGLIEGLAHFLIVCVWRHEIQAMLRSFDDLWQQLDATEQRCVTSFVKGVTIFTYFFLFQCGTSLCFYNATLWLVNGEQTSNSTTPRALPYPCFVKNVTRSPHYEIVYFLQVSTMTNVGITCVAANMLSPMMIMLTSGHLRVLQHRIDAMGHRFNNSRIKDLDTTCSKHLESCVESHWKIFSDQKSYGQSEHDFRVGDSVSKLEICTEITDLTNLMFVPQLFCCIVNLATVCFTITGDHPDKYKFLPHFLIVIMQLFVANWPPDVLMSESAAVADAAYRLPWYQWPCELRKFVQVVMRRSQKPVRLTAGKIVTMSFETFASVISSAMSLLAALRTVR